jgi:hypothetical protein
MTRFKLLGAAAILSLLAATPALAQHMIDEPGMFAFVYPMGDLGIASSRAPADARAMMLMQNGSGMTAMRAFRHPAPRRGGSGK